MTDRDRILSAIAAEARHIRDPHAREVFKRAAVQTGLVESNLRNLPGGDADSQGWRQERASLYPNPRNIEASARRFRQEFEQHFDPDEKSYEVAAQVQRPAAQYRGRYKDRAKDAERVLKGSGGTARAASATGTTTTVPGTDNSRQRAALVAAFLSEKKADPVQFALGIKGLRDTPDRTVTTSPSQEPAGSSKGRSPLLEMFWQGPGGINVKDGRKAPQGFVSGHRDHVHVAAGPKTVVQLGRLAQQMGLRVGENSRFTGQRETSGHAAKSYHYRDQAIDVSGDPKRMAAYARRVAQMYGIR